MRAVNWLRTRQEERELSYWLSIVAYDPHDRSFLNRAYLFYLTLFFVVWIFVMLTFFAGGGAFLLQLLSPGDPVRSAILLEILILGIWNIFALWQSMKRSPVAFSEQDATLVCQTPLNHRQIVLRWFLMPWVKSAIPFWIAGITIGFSLAEITMPGTLGASRIPEYAGYGLRAWIALIPIHLTLFSMQWIGGVYRLQKDKERRWLIWPVMATAIALFSFLLCTVFNLNLPGSILWNCILIPLRSGFGEQYLLLSVLTSSVFAIISLAILFWASGTFSLNRAVQETQEGETLKTALQYGFTSYAKDLQTKKRLGVSHSPSRLPLFAGAGILLWKDILQWQRSFRLSALSNWVVIFSSMLGLSLLPDLGSRVFAIAIWVVMLGKVSVIRLRSDLACWSLVRQLPIAFHKFILFELGSAYLLAILISMTGLAINSVIFKNPIDPFELLIPGVAAGVACAGAFDVIRRSRSNLLVNGSVPDVSAGGIILGIIVAAIPVFINTLLPGLTGTALSIFSSLLLGGGTFILAVRSYRNMNIS